MSKRIKIKFDNNQEHQIKAIESVVSLFTGLPKMETGFQMGDDVISNLPAYSVLEEHWLFENLLEVQKQYNQYAESIGSSSRTSVR
jgi:type III restriction enzyme